jgi:4-carboxymuconolactone decarboxylase
MAAESDEAPILALLAKMTEASLEATGLDDRTLMLVRIAALVSVDAPPASYMMNLGAAGKAGVDVDQVQGVLAGVAPIVGTARVVSAAGKMVRALDLKLELGDLALEE